MNTRPLVEIDRQILAALQESLELLAREMADLVPRMATGRKDAQTARERHTALCSQYTDLLAEKGRLVQAMALSRPLSRPQGRNNASAGRVQ